jgi:hypothetical protein
LRPHSRAESSTSSLRARGECSLNTRRRAFPPPGRRWIARAFPPRHRGSR